MHLSRATPGDFANDLRRLPRIRRHRAEYPSFAARAICVISRRAEYNQANASSGTLGVFATGPKGKTDFGSATIVLQQPLGKEKVRVRIDYKAAKGWKAADTPAKFVVIPAKGKSGAGMVFDIQVKKLADGIYEEDVGPIRPGLYQSFGIVPIEDVNNPKNRKLVATRIGPFKP